MKTVQVCFISCLDYVTEYYDEGDEWGKQEGPGDGFSIRALVGFTAFRDL